MTSEEFIAKWRGVELPEVAASHDHFNELCELLDLGEPTDAIAQVHAYATLVEKSHFDSSDTVTQHRQFCVRFDARLFR